MHGGTRAAVLEGHMSLESCVWGCNYLCGPASSGKIMTSECNVRINPERCRLLFSGVLPQLCSSRGQLARV